MRVTANKVVVAVMFQVLPGSGIDLAKAGGAAWGITPCHVLRMSYQVLGKEMITGISGKPLVTWKISVPETRFTFWIACKKPRLEQVFWPGPGGKGVFFMAPVE
jgi:hypothetical protein